MTDETRQRISSSVRQAARRRYAYGYKPISPAGRLNKICYLLGCKPDLVVDAVELIEGNHRRVCSNLQDVAQELKLGLGGEQVDELVIKELRRLSEAMVLILNSPRAAGRREALAALAAAQLENKTRHTGQALHPARSNSATVTTSKEGLRAPREERH